MAASLLVALPAAQRQAFNAYRCTALDAGSWDEFVAELRTRFPTLAERVFSPAGEHAAGVLIAVDDTVVPPGTSPLLSSRSTVTLIPQLAGG